MIVLGSKPRVPANNLPPKPKDDEAAGVLTE